MRKLFALMIAAALLGVQSGRAELLGLSNIKTDGSIEILGNQANNETDLDGPSRDHRGSTITRVRVGLNMDVTEGVSGRVEFVRNGDTSEEVLYGDDGKPTTLNDEQDIIYVGSAYL